MHMRNNATEEHAGSKQFYYTLSLYPTMTFSQLQVLPFHSCVYNAPSTCMDAAAYRKYRVGAAGSKRSESPCLYYNIMLILYLGLAWACPELKSKDIGLVEVVSRSGAYSEGG